MFLNESYNTVVAEAKVIFRKRGNKVKRAFRCTVGPRKGRPVANPSQCAAPINLKKRLKIHFRRSRFQEAFFHLQQKLQLNFYFLEWLRVKLGR